MFVRRLASSAADTIDMLKSFKELFGEHYVTHATMFKTGATLVGGATVLNQIITGVQLNMQLQPLNEAIKAQNEAIKALSKKLDALVEMTEGRQPKKS